MPFDALQPFTIVKATKLEGACSWQSYTVRQKRRTFDDVDEGTLAHNPNFDDIFARWERSLEPCMETFIPEWVQCDRCTKMALLKDDSVDESYSESEVAVLVAARMR